MSGYVEVRYLTDDRDQPNRREFVMGMGGNGDWYVGVVPEGQEGMLGASVRLCTSGGASSTAPGFLPGIANAFRALLEAAEKPGAEQKGIRVIRR